MVGYGILTNHDRDHCFVDLQVNVLFYSFWEGNVIFLTAPNQVELQNSEEHLNCYFSTMTSWKSFCIPLRAPTLMGVKACSSMLTSVLGIYIYKYIICIKSSVYNHLYIIIYIIINYIIIQLYNEFIRVHGSAMSMRSCVPFAGAKEAKCESSCDAAKKQLGGV